MHVVAMIMAGGEGSRLTVLSEERAKPSVPFAGKYRIIDFTLSNCINSGIYDIAILTQYRPHSLNEHIGIGKPWDLDRMHGGVRLLQPYQARGTQGWYRGTADAVYQNLDYLFNHDAARAIILSGDHIYKMDYRQMLAFHEQKGADLTVAVMHVPLEETNRFGIMTINKNHRITEFSEKPANQDKGTLASMGIYIFNVEKLALRLDEGHQQTAALDFGKHIIPSMIDDDKVYAYEFSGYWVDVGTVDAYWRTSLELCSPDSPLDLWDPSFVIRTRSQERPPVKISTYGRVHNSLVSNGCTIHGQVLHSVLSPGVYVGPGAVIRESVIMNDAWIGAGAIVHQAVIDKNVVVGPSARVGDGDDLRANAEMPNKLFTGISVVGKGAHIAANVRIGRNVLIYANVDEPVMASTPIIPSGATVTRKEILLPPPSRGDTAEIEPESSQEDAA
ncbi:MAG: glucose-1-phosphate adenylyltransferase [Chloroflexi bacterium]|nr:glucose-1-phosphate adenylyltransferase [Chloroflexota bacterium]